MNTTFKIIYSSMFICGEQRLLWQHLCNLQPTTPAKDLMDSVLTVVILAIKGTHVMLVSKVKQNQKKKNSEEKQRVETCN